jgi:nicotinamide mononucleotide adenylyltransferase
MADQGAGVNFSNPFRTLTPVEMLSKQLAEAQCDRVVFAASVEEQQHHLTMLNARIARIRLELKAIADENKDQPS